eukprot:scaffold137108_cov35-Tisochrysis_lutea.AAC.1
MSAPNRALARVRMVRGLSSLAHHPQQPLVGVAVEQCDGGRLPERSTDGEEPREDEQEPGQQRGELEHHARAMG